ncbi:MAG TPA: HepT-like ribonuclease domain-containing protein [Syntrophomonadaceae bacterium]|nr:HepT-like ribonuclease domain-containing protein [Syntrophomonadaceae bacterium]
MQALAICHIGIVSKSFSKRLGNMAGFRNILVHDYTKIKPEIIINILKKDI